MAEKRDQFRKPFDRQSEMHTGDDYSRDAALAEDQLRKAQSFEDVLAQLREIGQTNAKRGKLFERLIKRYLETDPVYTAQFKRVRLWAECPEFAGPDTGVDLVADYRDDVNGGGICAIQTKFYAEDGDIRRGDVSNFLTASQRIGAVGRIFVTTSDRLARSDQQMFDSALHQTHVIGKSELANADVSWPDITNPEAVASTVRKYELRCDQKRAIQDCIDGFGESDRGQLILPCGVGKTFTALRLSEELVGVGGTVLYLVPSIALLAQTMREWSRQRRIDHRYIGVCSDESAGKQTGTTDGSPDGFNLEDASLSELAIPVTTDADRIGHALSVDSPTKLTVLFSTYQSLDRIAAAQGVDHWFDLIICDEAHRTTGVERESDPKSASKFVIMHDNHKIRARRRLYMTATPRIYGDSAKAKAREDGEIALFSMDDPEKYGTRFHEMSFVKAVEEGLLTDYKVLVLGIPEDSVKDAHLRAKNPDETHQIDVGDAAKIVGCTSALFDPTASEIGGDAGPLLRAIAFCNLIENSKAIATNWNPLANEARGSSDAMSESARAKALPCSVEHVDGTMSALNRSAKIDWLRTSGDEEREVRVLSNARCLSEGVDVPALDAVLFMQPRASQVDVVQGVGRVMRIAPNKEYGYVILPVAIPSNMDPAEALDNSEAFEVVWNVLQALRSHDGSLDAEINRLDRERSPDDKIQIIGVIPNVAQADGNGGFTKELGRQPTLDGEFVKGFFGKLVERCGTRHYWPTWAKNVAVVVTRIQALLTEIVPNDRQQSNGPNAIIRQRFDSLTQAMREATNESLSDDEVLSVVAQHIVTAPVFESLFPEYDFSGSNPVAGSLNQFVSEVAGLGLDKELEGLARIYEYVKTSVKETKTPDGRRRVLEELYQNFFSKALPKEADRLGVVYTPHELVDFVLHSANDVLRSEFGKTLADPGVHILDPFAGMGTFIWRLIRDPDLIPDDALDRKFRYELHANEILPLAYYMSAINIEEAYRERKKAISGHSQVKHERFKGIVYRDTFNARTDGIVFRDNSNSRTGRIADGQPRMMEENDERAKQQDETQITVIVGNPPYRARQSDASDENPNFLYPELFGRVTSTYGAKSSATLKGALQDPYKLAMRWSTDKLDGGMGITAFVTSARFIGSKSDDGLRACLQDDYTKIYCANLRGDLKSAGNAEGGSVFPSGTTLPIAVSVLVSDGIPNGVKAHVHYWEVDDNLSGEEKRGLLRELGSVRGILDWRVLKTTEDGGWLDQGDPTFSKFDRLGFKGKDDGTNDCPVFNDYRNGLSTNRDPYLYDFSEKKLVERLQLFIEAYETARKEYAQSGDELKAFRSQPGIIKWDRELKARAKRGVPANDLIDLVDTHYRPFVRKRLALDKVFISIPGIANVVDYSYTPGIESIYVPGVANTADFTPLIVDRAPNLHLLEGGQGFPRAKHEPMRDDIVQRNATQRNATQRNANSRARENVTICVTGIGALEPFSALVAKGPPDLSLVNKGQCFPRYALEPIKGERARKPKRG